MKLSHLIVLSLIAVVLPLPACRQVPGSVNRDNVAETLQSPQMAVTDSLPGWMLEQGSISKLTEEEIARLRTILLPEQVRSVPEKYYRDTAAGNRADDSDSTFYIYASNAQCLGGRVVEDKVLMDDFSLSEQQKAQLTELLMPHLRKIGIVK